ncbi:MAG: hypothetical protein ACK5IB_06430 [Qingshengfaniella sp.]
MDPSLLSVWPKGLGTSLWNFDALRPERVPQLPFLQINFEREFQISFVIGIVLIALFAWRQFRHRTFEVDEGDYRIFNELDPADLRGRGPIFRAYLTYIGVLIVLFILLTFFGKLILTTIAPVLPVAGLQVDVSNLNFDSYEWPLTLALAFVGANQILPQVGALERWLRGWAHRTVGIPVMIRAKTHLLIDQMNQTEPGHAARLREVRAIQPWVRTHIGETDNLENILLIRDQLRSFLIWHRQERWVWPENGIRSQLRRIEGMEAEQTVKVLREFEDILKQNYLAVPESVDPDKDTPRSLPDLSALPEDPPQVAVEQVYPGFDGDPLQNHQWRLETALDDILARMRALRLELAAILTIYGERDDRYDRIRDTRPRQLMRAVFPQPSYSAGPTIGVALLLVPAFILFALGAALEWHSLLGPVEPGAVTILVTGLLEMLRFANLFWLPLLAAFYLRLLMMEHDAWEGAKAKGERTGEILQMLLVLIVALGVAGLFQSLLAFFWVALFSKNVDRFQEVLFSRDYAFYWYFLTEAFFTVPFVYFCLKAADLQPRHRSRLVYGLIGVCSALSVFLVVWMHNFLWSGRPAPGQTCGGGIFLVDILTMWRDPPSGWTVQDCFRWYGILNVALYMGTAFLAAAFFIRPPRQSGATPVVPPKGEAALPVPSRTVLRAVVCLIGMAAVFGAVRAQGQQAWSSTKTPIVVGFRMDAEPFSYLVQRTGEQVYKGYIADICHQIFDDSPYEVVAVPLTARSRFMFLRITDDPPFDPGQPAYDRNDMATGQLAGGLDVFEASGRVAFLDRMGRQPVDVICDPVTLRYFAERQGGVGDIVSKTGEILPSRSDGLFSPIVFASGVSYLRRPGPKGNVQLAFVANSTASEVARRACLANLFRISGNTLDVARCADANDQVWRSTEPLGCQSMAGAVLSGQVGYSPTAALTYEVCVQETHSDIIAWLCDPGATEERVYFGDRDIILGKLRAYRAAHPACDSKLIEEKQETYTYEPYALVVTQTNAALYQHVQRRIYELFSHRSAANSLFTKYFPGQRMTDPLAWLFLLNAVSEENNFRHATSDWEGEGGNRPGP